MRGEIADGSGYTWLTSFLPALEPRKKDLRVTERIARLSTIPIGDVWNHEARDLTPWLAQNLDDLGEALGMNVELDGTQVSVGPFSADLVLSVPGTSERVVVELMMGNTDHDHVGKLITYAAGLEASHAVLIAADFRPEHRSALDWLNARSIESTGFFGLVLRAVRIDDSRPAPLFDVVVKPDSWVRSTREAHGGQLSERESLYREFWSGFLERLRQREPEWIGDRTPSKNAEMVFHTGKGSITYRAAFQYVGDSLRLVVLLYVDGRDAGEADARFAGLERNREGIDSAFPGELEWERPSTQRANRIICMHAQPADVRERERWDELASWGVDCLSAMREALQEHVAGLP